MIGGMTLGLVLGSGLGLTRSLAQQGTESKTQAASSTGPVGYQSGKRSPFEDPARRPKRFGPPPSVKPFPSAQQRLQEYLTKRQHAKAVGAKLPSPLSAYLVSELEVNGIYKTKEGWGAFVRAKTTDTTFFVRIGDKAFNGEIVRIEPRQVVFTDITWMLNGPDQVKQISKGMTPPNASSAKPETAAASN